MLYLNSITYYIHCQEKLFDFFKIIQVFTPFLSEVLRLGKSSLHRYPTGQKDFLKGGGSQYPFNSTNLLAITFLRLFI